MTSTESPSNPSRPSLNKLESGHDWLQTQGGDWILPSVNALHFGREMTPTATGASLQSKSHAQRVLQSHFGNRLHREDRLYIVIGSDSGQLLRYVREHAPLPRGSRWLFIEPDDILEALLQNPTVTGFCDDYVKLVGLDEWKEQAALLQLPGYFRIDGVVLERSLGALDGTDSQYIDLTAFFDAELTALRFRTTVNLNMAPFIEPHILSAPNFLDGIEHLEKLFADRQAVIIAGGPSLDDQINWLCAHRESLFLIAVSRTSARLIEAGINPDIIVTVDPFPISLTVSRQMFDFPERTILVTSSHPYPVIANRWPGSIFCAGKLVPWHDDEINPERSLSMAGPTVTHMAAELAVFMGFSEVIFCGLDLCHAPDGRTHATGSSEAAAGPLMEFSAIPVTTNAGQSTWTTPDYYAGRGAMAAIAERATDVRFINPSPNAANIDHVEHRELDDIGIPNIPFDRTPLDRLRVEFTEASQKRRLKILAGSIESIRDELEKVGNLAQLGLESNQAYFHLTHPERQRRHKRRMQAIDRLFQGRYRRGAQLAQRAATRAIMRTDLPHDFFALDRRQAEHLANNYYDAIREQARRLNTPLELALERVVTRQMERDGTTSAEQLARRYLEHGEPERIRWLERQRPGVNGEAVQEAKAAYNERIEELLTKDRERHRRKRSPRVSLRQIERYFSHRNREALTSLAKSLENHREGKIALPYAAYARGLERELVEELPSAAAEHAQVIEQADTEEDTTLIEHALLRLGRINIEAEQIADALTMLHAAAGLNPTHWRMVARLALLDNHAETGITALTRHLEHFPGDVERIKQMVRLFVALQIPDGVRFCEQYLPYCRENDREALDEFLKDAKQTLDVPNS